MFSHQYIVQDDARQHVVWLQRYVEPGLFPNDIIANYFSSLAPWGYKSLYFVAAKVGIAPILFAKLLPPVLGVITTIYIYCFTLEIMPITSGAFLSSLLLNQIIWLNDDLVSATPRAFVYPLFAAFLYYLARKALVPCLVTMLLQGLFYPQLLLVEMAVLSLRLLVIKGKAIARFTTKLVVKFTTARESYLWWMSGLVVTAIALYPLTQKPTELATVVTAQQMQEMPEFNLGGRSPFFGDGWLKYWLAGSSGFSLPLFPPIVWAGCALPWLLTTKLSIIKIITSKVKILQEVAIASLMMFFIAHILLPTLHLPSRYTYHTLRFVMVIATAIVLTVLIDLAKSWLVEKRRSKSALRLADKLKIALVTLFSLTVVIFPAVPQVFTHWFQGWQVGTVPAIYQYLAQQPQDTLVASLSSEANNIPAFAQRSILVGDEFAMAYHPIYHQQIRQRTIDLLAAQYSSDVQALTAFIQKYGVDYLLVDSNAFAPEYLLTKDWLINSSWQAETEQAIAKLKSNSNSVLQELVPSCAVVSTAKLNLLSSKCLRGFASLRNNQ